MMMLMLMLILLSIVWRRVDSSFCFCSKNEFFFARFSSTQCERLSSSTLRCDENRFSPLLIDLIPRLTNDSRCWNDSHCLHSLSIDRQCNRCQLISSGQNQSCFHLCPEDKSCGFVCFNRVSIISIDCHGCHERRENLTCRCLGKVSPSSSSPRWTQKRGLPAAAILAVLVVATLLLTVLIKQIYRQLDIIERRRNGSVRSSFIPNCSEAQLSRTRGMTFSSITVDIVRTSSRPPVHSRTMTDLAV